VTSINNNVLKAFLENNLKRLIIENDKKISIEINKQKGKYILNIKNFIKP